MSQLVLFNKPFDVLCQFTDEKHSGETRLTLTDFINLKNVYPAGRLDKDSEGLLLLTDNGKFQHKISHPEQKMAKSYWVQVEGNISPDAVKQLQAGIKLKDGLTLPAKARKIPEPPVWPRNPPIRERKNIPTSWLNLTITEGKNRQVRRMTAATGFPTLRLIRYQIGSWHLEDLLPGEYQTLQL